MSRTDLSSRRRGYAPLLLRTRAFKGILQTSHLAFVKASRGEGTEGVARGAERHQGSSQHSTLLCTEFHPQKKQERKRRPRQLTQKKASKERMVKSDSRGRVPEKRGMNQIMHIVHGFRRFFASAHRLCPLVIKVCATPQLDPQRTGGTIRRRPQAK